MSTRMSSVFSRLSNALSRRDADRERRRSAVRRRLSLEGLESRRTLTAELVGTTLIITGTPNDDFIGIANDGTDLRAKVNEMTYSFPAASVERIAVRGWAGHDQILVRAGVLQPARLEGGEGNDRIVAGGGDSILSGGGGNDLLAGGGGSDRLLGGDDSDLLEGGDGDDALAGGDGEDWLVGGLGADFLDGGNGPDHIKARDGAIDTIVTDLSDEVIADEFDVFVP